MLLTEYRPFIVDKVLAEQAIKENKPLIVQGVLQRAEAKNQNGRVYPKEILKREVEEYMKGPVAENRAMGELDHPESSVINLQNVSHNVKKCWWDGDDVMGDVEILSTPAGNILKALFAAGITVGISSRGMGSVKENMTEGTVEVQDDFELLCWDFVSTPSTHGAFMTPKMNTHINEIKNKLPKYKYTNVNNIIRDILYVAPKSPILDLLKRMRSSRIHIGLVVDEFGGVDGLITIEDLVEEIVGEIEDEHDADDSEEIFQKIDDKTILVKSGYKIEDMEKYYDVKIKIDDEEIDTVGGLLFFLANKVPKNSQVYNYEDILQFKVIKASARRIESLQITKIK